MKVFTEVVHKVLHRGGHEFVLCPSHKIRGLYHLFDERKEYEEECDE